MPVRFVVRDDMLALGSVLVPLSGRHRQIKSMYRSASIDIGLEMNFPIGVGRHLLSVHPWEYRAHLYGIKTLRIIINIFHYSNSVFV